MLNLDQHPCFNAEVKGHCGRVHLPVAPKCNILCNYCNRKFDCANESRPGVSSAVLSPPQAIAYLEQVLQAEPRITVAGIAGPGDPFANPRETMETLRLIRRRFPDLLLCLASNGLGLLPYLDELAELKVSHVTITVNAVSPEIGSRIYGWVRDQKRVYRGIAAAELLLSRQLAAIAGLKARGLVVKVNTIVIPGVNEHYVPEVARKMAELGADLLNCMPVYPNADTPFGMLSEPEPAAMAAIQAAAGEFLPQMRHCTRCRADAVGLLGEDRSREWRGCLTACAQTSPASPDESRPYVAVASREGALVNLHLGEVDYFQFWGPADRGFRLLEERAAPAPGGGANRWWAMAEILKDCRAVLVSALGDTPEAILREAGVILVQMSGVIEVGLSRIYAGESLTSLKGRQGGLSRACCGKGQGEGCL